MITLRTAVLVAAALVAAGCSSSRNSAPPPPPTPAPPPAPPPDPTTPVRSCNIPECFRAVECCAVSCRGPRVYSSCCPCRADEIDAITCPSHHCGG